MKKAIIFILLLSCLLCACDGGYNRHSAGASGHDDALQIIRTAVPHNVSMSLRLDIITLQEEDAYGRRLFSYYMNEGPQIEVLLICQKTEGALTYYYEDYCYLLRYRMDAEFTQEDIIWLKEQNNWDQPLVESKMRALDYTTQKDDIVEYRDVRKVIENTLNRNSPDYFIWLNGLETDAEGNQLILVESDQEKTDNTEYYLILYRHDDPAGVIAKRQIGYDSQIRERVIAFKEEFFA